MSRTGRGIVRGVATVALVLLAGCSTTVSTTSGPISDPQFTPKPEAVDATRRVEVRMELATGYFQRGQFDIALEEVKRALDINPNLGAAHNLRGLILASQGKDGPAEESFRQALRIDARDADALQNYGWFLCQRRRYAEGDAMFVQAVEALGPRDTSRTLLAQGVCAANAGQITEAERLLTRAYEIDPSNVSTAYNLADVLYRRGEFERARFYVRRINSQPALVSAQSLWLAARIENRLGNQTGAQEFGRQLRARFGDTREAMAYERGQFNE